MEICNYNCLYSGRDTYSTTAYRDLLEQGNRLFPIGCDDMHTIKSHAGAWIMAGAETLTYDTLIRQKPKAIVNDSFTMAFIGVNF